MSVEDTSTNKVNDFNSKPSVVTVKVTQWLVLGFIVLLIFSGVAGQMTLLAVAFGGFLLSAAIMLVAMQITLRQAKRTLGDAKKNMDDALIQARGSVDDFTDPLMREFWLEVNASLEDMSATDGPDAMYRSVRGKVLQGALMELNFLNKNDVHPTLAVFIEHQDETRAERMENLGSEGIKEFDAMVERARQVLARDPL